MKEGDNMMSNICTKDFLSEFEDVLNTIMENEKMTERDAVFIRQLIDYLITFRAQFSQKYASLAFFLKDLERILIDEKHLIYIVSYRGEMLLSSSELLDPKRIGVIIDSITVLVKNSGLPLREISLYLRQIGKIENLNKTRETETPNFKHFCSASSPIEIYDHLCKMVVGQTRAKQDLSILAYEYMKSSSISANSIALLGESGCGKTYLAECLAKIVGIPYVLFDCSNITPEGFTGASSSDICKIIDKELKKSSSGKLIVVLDEFDKLCMPNYDSKQENVSDLVMGQFMNILSGKQLPSGKNSKQCFFILCGCFFHLRDDKEKETKKNKIGFGNVDTVNSVLCKEITREDLCRAGMLPELARRIQEYVLLDPLTDEQIYEISKLDSSCFQKRSRRINECYDFEIDASRIVGEILSEIKEDDNDVRDGFIGYIENEFSRRVNSMILEHYKMDEKCSEVTK